MSPTLVSSEIRGQRGSGITVVSVILSIKQGTTVSPASTSASQATSTPFSPQSRGSCLISATRLHKAFASRSATVFDCEKVLKTHKPKNKISNVIRFAIKIIRSDFITKNQLLINTNAADNTAHSECCECENCADKTTEKLMFSGKSDAAQFTH